MLAREGEKDKDKDEDFEKVKDFQNFQKIIIIIIIISFF